MVSGSNERTIPGTGHTTLTSLGQLAFTWFEKWPFRSPGAIALLASNWCQWCGHYTRRAQVRYVISKVKRPADTESRQHTNAWSSSSSSRASPGLERSRFHELPPSFSVLGKSMLSWVRGWADGGLHLGFEARCDVDELTNSPYESSCKQNNL